MLLLEAHKYLAIVSLLKPVREPDAVKVARPVRGRVVGKVPPDGNSLATYSTGFWGVVLHTTVFTAKSCGLSR